MGYIGNAPSQGLLNGGQIVDGTIDTVDLKDSAVTAAKLSSTAIKDKLATDQFLAVPRGTTAQRPVSPEIGYTRYNTDTGSLENYTANGWLKVSIPKPVVNSISGNIYSGVASTLTLSGFNFGVNTGSVKFTANGSTTTVNATPISDSSVSCVVPSAIYNLTSGTSVQISFMNADGGTSSAVTRQVIALPSGGAVTTSGNYRIHTFTNSGSFVTSIAITADYLLIAGGGAGGTNAGGGGGAGGLLYKSNQSIAAGTYSITIGAGGTSGGSDASATGSGSDSVAFGFTSIGGGGGINSNGKGASGGSGGGSSVSQTGGSGTSGQGNKGGDGNGNDGADRAAGGGGGAGAVGQNVVSNSQGGMGGNGLAYDISGTSTYYAGGGAGSSHYGNNTRISGGLGGGGASGQANYPSAGTSGLAGTSNTGGGGGAGAGGGYTGGNGGSGILIIRYQLP